MRPLNSRIRRQWGIALITTLLLLLLMSAMVVGFMLLVTEGQRLSGLNNDQSRAFYAAEAGMEKLTADIGALFGTTYAPSAAQVNALTSTPPVLPVSSTSASAAYVDALGNPAYAIAFPTDSKGNPLAQYAQITSGSSPFQGMTALETTYTLTVEARTSTGGDVKLQRTTQTVGIPLFQFGIFSQTDLSFFPGPNFNFGGRVHSNGNLFLDSGGPAGATPTQTSTTQLWLSSPVTAVGQILRDCLPNGYPESTSAKHPGSVEITKGGGVFQALGFGQGSWKGCLGSGSANTGWPTVSASFNGNVRSGVKPLNMTITLLGSASPVDIIRRPVQGENASNSGVLGERYFSQASLRVLISDNAADITSLPCVSSGAPLNLAHLAQPTSLWSSYTDSAALLSAMTTAGTPPLPLAASGAMSSTAYTAGTAGGDGYWQKPGIPTITGYIKIDAQTSYGVPCGTYKDVTQEILSLGYVGRNINPVPQSLDGANLNPGWGNTAVYQANMKLGAAPALPTLPGAQKSSQSSAPLASGTYTGSAGSCLDPHPNAVIRLERIRDNPSTVPYTSNAFNNKTKPYNLPVQSSVTQVCGVDPVTKLPVAGLQPSDFWPNVLFDTREGYNREPTPSFPFNTRVTLGGTMYYIELDVQNLAKWFSGTIGASGPSTEDPNVAPNNFVVYISDRRGNYVPTGTALGSWPPLSPSGHETGEYGYFDFVNSSSSGGCPDNALDPVNSTGVSPEDLDGTGILSTYGENTFPPGLIDSTGIATRSTLFSNYLTSTVADPLCTTGSAGVTPWPRTFLLVPNEARENPPALFRRALKIMDGNLISLPACPNGVSCGLTIATENPAYVVGDFNANYGGGGFGAPDVAASVVADAATLLSVNWNDVNSFAFPFNTGSRSGTTSYFRLGIVSGKQSSFAKPSWDSTSVDPSQDFGTDGGVHNFLRFLEGWSGTLYYQGSIVSMFYTRQAVGMYNSGNNNYSPPTRGYSFDVNFLNPTLLPPRTPMFRDVNTTGFTQLLLPNQ